MFEYDDRGELASRDIVARAIEIEQNKIIESHWKKRKSNKSVVKKKNGSTIR